MSTVIYGNCSCGKEYMKIEGDSSAFRKNGNKFIDPEDKEHRFDAFRCGSCYEVIEKTFKSV